MLRVKAEMWCGYHHIGVRSSPRMVLLGPRASAYACTAVTWVLVPGIGELYSTFRMYSEHTCARETVPGTLGDII